MRRYVACILSWARWRDTAVTCVYGLPDPNFSRVGFSDVLEALDASPKPTILVLEQKFPREIAGKVGAGRREHDGGDAGGRLCGLHFERAIERY